MKTILLPTDFSKNSINAINYAVALFKNETCKFYILNVQRASSFISDDLMVINASTTIYSTIIDASKKSIANVIKKIEKKYKNEKHEFESIVDYDNFIDSINQVCELKKINLIVMGTKGATGLNQVFFGSNTVKVIQRCQTPVLVIPNNVLFNDLENITFTTSYNRKYDINDLRILNYLIESNNSKLSVLHINVESDYAPELNVDIDFFKKYFKQLTCKYLESNTNDIFTSVEKYISDNDVKMLAMVNRKHSFFERLFTKHAVETFAFSINIPFLVIPRTN